jgi:hypothetical protein
MVIECVFCEIMAGRVPADVVYQDDMTVALIDPRQHNPGHVLVVPRTHINDIGELDSRTGAALMDTLIKIGMDCCACTAAHPLTRNRLFVRRMRSACGVPLQMRYDTQVGGIVSAGKSLGIRWRSIFEFLKPEHARSKK